jgi:hypothetical protein
MAWAAQNRPRTAYELLRFAASRRLEFHRWPSHSEQPQGWR